VTGCAFCGRDVKIVRYLIAGPNAAICDGCVQMALHTRPSSPAAMCSFCGELEARTVMRSVDHAICVTCVELSQEILQAQNVQLPRAIVHRDKA
jgi:ATP-dependent protease Clp ATPase subunit